MNAAATALRQRLPAARKVWSSLCFCLGLTAGLWLSLMGLTGAALVFNGPLLRMEVGRERFSPDNSPAFHAAVDQWIANAHRAYGDFKAVEFVSGPGYGFAGGTTLTAEAVGNKHSVVSINPEDGRPLGTFVWEDTYSTSILKFHARLAASLSWIGHGRYTTASIGAAMLGSMAAGLYLWWPRNRGGRGAFVSARGTRGLRRLLDLHNLAAVYLFIPLLVLGFTGVYLAYPGSIDPAVSLLSVARTPDPDALARASKPGSCESRTTPGQAVALAQARFGSAKFVSIAIPKGQPYIVQLAPPNNVGDKGQTQVFVDRECPVVLTAIDGEIGVPAETFKALMHPLHRYLMLGWAGQVIAFLASLLLPLSLVTGLLLWRDKSKNRGRSL